MRHSHETPPGPVPTPSPVSRGTGSVIRTGDRGSNAQRHFVLSGSQTGQDQENILAWEDLDLRREEVEDLIHPVPAPKLV